MQFLENRPVNQNPYYETLLNYGAYIAARMNAEQGRSYNVEKIINWCFEPTSVVRIGWGVALGSWNGYPADGLAASVIDGGGYAFAMDTFAQFGQMVPLVRYDNRFARAIGRYAINAASNARFFYANGVPLANQSGSAWASDSQNVIAYEGLRKQAKASNKAISDYAHAAGTVVSGTYADTRQLDSTNQVLREAVAGTFDILDHVWEFDVPAGTDRSFGMWGWRTDGGDGDSGFRYSYSANPGGPWTTMFTINAAANQWYGYPLSGLGSKCYIRVEDTNLSPGNTSLDTLYVAMMYVMAEQPSLSPYAMGDPVYAGWGATDYGLYGSSHVGLMGGIIDSTNILQILKLDLLKTDFLRDPAYPTYLYYNPLGTAQTVTIDVGAAPTNLYDAVSNTVLRTGATGATDFQVPSDSAVVLTLLPGGATPSYSGSKMLVNGIVADYSATPPSGVRDWELY
jgi:hypothetical protein